MSDIEVETKIGKFTLRRPKAGVRNRAMIKASEGRDAPNKLVFIMEVLPDAIVTHPFTDLKMSVKKQLDNMEDTEWDKVSSVVIGWYKDEEVDELTKKLDGQSKTEEPKTSESTTS